MTLFLPLPYPQGPGGWSTSLALVPPTPLGTAAPGTLISLVLFSDPGFSQRVHRCRFLSRIFPTQSLGDWRSLFPSFLVNWLNCPHWADQAATTESPSVPIAPCLFRTHPGLLQDGPVPFVKCPVCHLSLLLRDRCSIYRAPGDVGLEMDMA